MKFTRCLAIRLIGLVTIASASHDSQFPRPYQLNKYGVLTKKRIYFKRLPSLEKDLRYTFILVRHGMVAPDKTKSKSYLSDKLYKPIWRPGQPTTRGRTLLHMIGRSLSTRYLNFLDELDWREIRISCMDKKYAEKLALDLTKGMLSHSKHRRHFIEHDEKILDYAPEYDKHNLLADGRCVKMEKILNNFKENLDGPGTLQMNYCNSTLYDNLRTYVLPHRGDEEWLIDSPSKVFNLWEVLMFETHEGQKLWHWIVQNWYQLQGCVFEYHKFLLSWGPEVASMIVGRLVNQVDEEISSQDVRFHVHITDDISMLALNWSLPQSSKQESPVWPDYGDVLILDLFTDRTVQVSTYSGLMNSFITSYKADYCDFKQWFKQHRLSQTKQQWDLLCRSDDENLPPVHDVSEEKAEGKSRNSKSVDICSEDINVTLLPNKTSQDPTYQDDVWPISRKDGQSFPSLFETMVKKLALQNPQF